MKYTMIIVAFLISQHTFADSTALAKPTVNALYATENSNCSSAYQEAVTTNGLSLFCSNGKWRSVSANGYQRVENYYLRKPSDDNTMLVITASCPVGKRIIHTDCDFNGTTSKNETTFSHSDGQRTALCFFNLSDSYDYSAWAPGINSVLTTAVCVNIES